MSAHHTDHSVILVQFGQVSDLGKQAIIYGQGLPGTPEVYYLSHVYVITGHCLILLQIILQRRDVSVRIVHMPTEGFETFPV